MPPVVSMPALKALPPPVLVLPLTVVLIRCSVPLRLWMPLPNVPSFPLMVLRITVIVPPFQRPVPSDKLAPPWLPLMVLSVMIAVPEFQMPAPLFERICEGVVADGATAHDQRAGG